MSLGVPKARVVPVESAALPLASGAGQVELLEPRVEAAEAVAPDRSSPTMMWQRAEVLFRSSQLLCGESPEKLFEPTNG
jgi:hypothetical protein